MTDETILSSSNENIEAPAKQRVSIEFVQDSDKSSGSSIYTRSWAKDRERLKLNQLETPGEENEVFLNPRARN
jgi:hypothetical protein